MYATALIFCSVLTSRHRDGTVTSPIPAVTAHASLGHSDTDQGSGARMPYTAATMSTAATVSISCRTRGRRQARVRSTWTLRWARIACRPEKPLFLVVKLHCQQKYPPGLYAPLPLRCGGTTLSGMRSGSLHTLLPKLFRHSKGASIMAPAGGDALVIPDVHTEAHAAGVT